MSQSNATASLEPEAWGTAGHPSDNGPRDLRADGQSADRAIGENLVAVVTSKTPVLTWKPGKDSRERGTTGFEVEVRDSADELVWSSGTIVSGATTFTVGRELRAHSAYNWRVRTADGGGRWSRWSRSTLETGPFEYEDWHASWLSVDHLTRIMTTFRVVRPIVKARMYLTGQGVVRAWVNDTTVNADRMDPTRTDFVRALFRSYDVAGSLIAGDNTLAFVCGLGEWARTGESPRLLAELMIWHDDGSVTRIAPDASSVVTPSSVVIDEPFYLERHDACTAERPAPSVPKTGSPSELQPARSPASPATPPLDITADPTPPVRAVTTFVPVEIGSSPGARLFDIGTNIAGRFTITIHDGVRRGTVIRVQHGEHIGADGRIDTTNLTMPYDHGRDRQLVEYVTAGIPGEKHEPWFSYFGFRYVQIQGLPDEARISVSAHSMHTELAASGSVSTDSPVIEALLAAAERTLLNNVHGVPEDCPTREQAAWTGDTGSVAEYELAAFDSANFLSKWIVDLETSQHSDGRLPAIAPDLHAKRMPSDPVWGSALHRMLLGHLLHYGDYDLVRRAIPALRRWADFQLTCVDDAGVVSGSPISYGHDWLALEQTPPPVHHTAGVIDCLVALAELEDAIGEADAAAQRRRTVDGLRAAARRAFFDPETGTFGNGSQGSYAAAIEAGILTGAEANAAAERLAELVSRRGNRVSSGFALTRSVVRALTTHGRSHVIYDILTQQEEPGAGAMLSSGPGTFWECWWIDPSNTGTGSLNHVGLGGPFASWVWEGLAGLRPTAPGYTKFRVAPQFIHSVTRLELRTDTVRGELLVGYSRTGSRARLEITVPAGSEGTLTIAGRPDAVLTPGSHVIDVEGLVIHSPEPERGPEPGPERGPGHEPGVAQAIATRSPVSADIAGYRTLLDDCEVVPGRANPSLEMLPTLKCMPVPHEQPDHAVLKVLAGTTHEDDCGPTVILGVHTPIPVDGIRFVYALIDECMDGPDRATRLVLKVHLSNGEILATSTKGWPAGWNRVAVDLGSVSATGATAAADSAQHIAITAIEVGLEFAGEIADNALALYERKPDHRAGFHLAEVGFSARKRTW